MMDKERGDGNTILLTVIGVATLLVALVGATFAYFSAQITNESTQSMNIRTAAPVGLRYVGQDLTLPNAIPTAHGESSFTVTNPDTSAYAQQYDLVLKVDKNEFTTALGNGNTEADTEKLKDQLEIKITSSTSGSTTMKALLDGGVYNYTDGTTSTDKNLVTGQRIEPGEVHTYAVTMDFKELDIPQNANQGKSFQAHIEIANPVSIQ